MGGGGGKKRKHQEPPLFSATEADEPIAKQEAQEAGSSIPENAMGKKMASADKKVRDKAVLVMSKWMAQQKDLDEEAHVKVWKALYYCYWMSDKPLVQQDLADKLSMLLHSFPNHGQSLLFLRAFWQTMLREWPGIDRLRLDKFYNLVRCVQRQAFSLLSQRSWRAKDITEYNDLMAGASGPLRPNSPIVGLQLHTVEIFLEELSDAVQSDMSHQVLTHLVAPYLQLLRETKDTAVIARVVRALEALAGEKWLAASLADGEEGEEDPMLKEPLRHNNRMFKHTYVPAVPQLPVTDACKDPKFAGRCAHAVTRRIFRIAISPSTTEASRKKLYELLETYKDVCSALGMEFTEDPDDVLTDEEGVQPVAGKGGHKGAGSGEAASKKRAVAEEEESDSEGEEEVVQVSKKAKKSPKGKGGGEATPAKGKKGGKGGEEGGGSGGKGKGGTLKKRKLAEEAKEEARERGADDALATKSRPGKLSVEERKALRESVGTLSKATAVLSSPIETTVSPRRHAATAADFFLADVAGSGKKAPKEAAKGSAAKGGKAGKEKEVVKARSPKERAAKKAKK